MDRHESKGRRLGRRYWQPWPPRAHELREPVRWRIGEGDWTLTCSCGEPVTGTTRLGVMDTWRGHRRAAGAELVERSS